ncbi:hypothetical protein THAOC_22826 [Thalassiosira oceanica]|uniref:Uncharacterized protein n=1 Tax=Thalassiosira oceanica TaxID=159749 RepID=K0RW30_THAOC|nr:hypothetical protein THAOC_22826 [Thalassiosira oceanica]|eukprot:EJK57160.1 hypothetical protein THAOC_22826 [Thalassiosira oceanica]
MKHIYPSSRLGFRQHQVSIYPLFIVIALGAIPESAGLGTWRYPRVQDWAVVVILQIHRSDLVGGGAVGIFSVDELDWNSGGDISSAWNTSSNVPPLRPISPGLRSFRSFPFAHPKRQEPPTISPPPDIKAPSGLQCLQPTPGEWGCLTHKRSDAIVEVPLPASAVPSPVYLFLRICSASIAPRQDTDQRLTKTQVKNEQKRLQYLQAAFKGRHRPFRPNENPATSSSTGELTEADYIYLNRAYGAEDRLARFRMTLKVHKKPKP